MQFLLLAAAFIGISYACDSCDSGADRETQTGCRLFCHLDVDGDGLITRENFVERFNGWNGGNPVPQNIFVPEITRVTQLCEAEGDSMFVLFAGLGDSDENMIEEIDMTTLFEMMELITGTDHVNREQFDTFYFGLYLIIEECEA